MGQEAGQGGVACQLTTRPTSDHVSAPLLLARKLVLPLCLKVKPSASSLPLSRPGDGEKRAPGGGRHSPGGASQLPPQSTRGDVSEGCRTVGEDPLSVCLPPGGHEALGAAVESLELDALQRSRGARVHAAQAALHSLPAAGAEPAAAEEGAVGAVVGGGGAVRAADEDVRHNGTTGGGRRVSRGRAGAHSRLHGLLTRRWACPYSESSGRLYTFGASRGRSGPWRASCHPHGGARGRGGGGTPRRARPRRSHERGQRRRRL